MKVLVTGAAGFIGSYLVPALLDRDAEVVVADMAASPDALSHVAKRIEYVRADMSSAPDVYRLVMIHQPTHVIHLVSLLAAPCEANPILGWRVNFQSTQYLLDACVASGVQRFIMTSSISVFGKGLAEPVPDDAPKNPALIYGQTKLASEHLMDWYRRNCYLSTGAVRFPWVFGPGRETGITALYSSKLLDAVAAGEPLHIPNPDEKGDWLYVKDAVKALLMLLDARDTPRIAYNIMGSLHSIREVMELTKELYPEAQITYAEGGAAQSPYPMAYDDSNARNELGWKPDFSIADAVKDHIETKRGGKG